MGLNLSGHSTFLRCYSGGILNPDDFPPPLLDAAPGRGEFDSCFSPVGVAAGLWLFHGSWERAHEAAQSLNRAEGSFWHGIIHRREPDAWNAKYWFAKVGAHPVYPTLVVEVGALLAGFPGCVFRLGSRWDAGAWVDFYDRAHRNAGSTDARLAEEIDRMERRLLLDYCSRKNS